MCDGGCSACASPKTGFQPLICIGDLSKSAQQYLKITPNATGLNHAANGTDGPKFDNMVQLSVKHCIRFDPCCTSLVSTPTAANLLAFLNTDPTNLPQGAAAWTQADIDAQKFLKGTYTCTSNCCR